MLTKQDIQKITEANKKIFITKKEIIQFFPSREEFDELRSDTRETKDIMNKLFNRIDKFLDKLTTLEQEFLITKDHLRRLEDRVAVLEERR